MKKVPSATTMQSMSKSIVKSALIAAKTAVPQKETTPSSAAETVLKAEKSTKTSLDPSMVSKEVPSKAKSKDETSNDETSKVETSKDETSKATSTAPVTTPKVEETSKLDKPQKEKEMPPTIEKSTEASSVTKSGTDVSAEENQQEKENTNNSNKDSNKDASDKER